MNEGRPFYVQIYTPEPRAIVSYNIEDVKEELKKLPFKLNHESIISSLLEQDSVPNTFPNAVIFLNSAEEPTSIGCFVANAKVPVKILPEKEVPTLEFLENKIEKAIDIILFRGLELSFSHWYSRSNCSFFEGSGFAEKIDDKFIKCNPLGALIIVNDGSLNNVYTTVSKILGVDDNWVIAFIHGWDDVQGTREFWNIDAYDLGVKLRIKYHFIYE